MYPPRVTAEPERAVLDANARFYDAFAARDFEAMNAAWSSDATIVCVHPGWPPIRGREPVLESFKAIFRSDEGPTPSCENPTVKVLGDAAFVVCRERLGPGVLVATNVFHHVDGEWRLAHHHASALARIPATPEIDPELLPN